LEPFTELTGVACPLDRTSVDTDQLIPARFMTRSRADGYGRYLLHDQRFSEDGINHLGHALDRPLYAGAKILVSAGEFGTGSSREAAVYALWDFGIRCVIASSFGDIFSTNATKNGLLTATVSTPDAVALRALIAGVRPPLISIDLVKMSILAGDMQVRFTIDPVRRQQLINGWDDIDLTLRKRSEIDAFRTALSQHQPWATIVLQNQ
jgi:3-isopropylmalate/(R)-2-methylmalate dehydratase small subunit